MRKLQAIIFMALLGLSASSQAFWGNSWGGWNPWPVWTPMYWMEEMVGDNDYYGGGPYGPYGGAYGPGGYPGAWGAPYGGAPYTGYGSYPYSLYPYGYTHMP